MASRKTTKKGIFKPLAAAFLESAPEEEEKLELHTQTVQQARQIYRQPDPIRSIAELTKEETRVMLKEQLVSRVSSELSEKKEAPVSSKKTEKEPAAEKKPVAKKASEKPAKAQKAEKPVKETAPVKKTAEKKAAPVSPKKTEKETVKAPAVKAAPAAAKKEETTAAMNNAELFIEYQGKSYNRDELVEKAVTIWVKKLRRGRSNITSLELYVKPQEQTVYYVFNGTRNGSFPL